MKRACQKMELTLQVPSTGDKLKRGRDRVQRRDEWREDEDEEGWKMRGVRGNKENKMARDRWKPIYRLTELDTVCDD